MIVLAIGAHPDDIEIYMAGTLLRLKKAGCEVHMWNLANGSCGSTNLDREEIVRVRQSETRAAAEILGAVLHAPLVDDLEIFYETNLLKKVAAVIRQIQPVILLVPSPDDYMEDHSNTARLAVTAAFARGMPNYLTQPAVPAWPEDIAIYHAQPRANINGMGKFVRPQRYVDIGSTLEQKRQMVLCHKSQMGWLEDSQKIGSLLNEVDDRAKKLGTACGKFIYAEGWRQHASGGFAPQSFDPMKALLQEGIWDDVNYYADNC